MITPFIPYDFDDSLASVSARLTQYYFYPTLVSVKWQSFGSILPFSLITAKWRKMVLEIFQFRYPSHSNVTH
jgi:hypothetical protein